MERRFHDRHDAGRVLAQHLHPYAHRSGVVVLALPRGGVPVGFEVARALHAKLDIFLVRKLGVPGHEELAMGAIASGGARVLNRDIVDALSIPDAVIDAVAAREQEELARRERAYRNNLPPLDMHGQTAILVDDGLATGATMRAAAEALGQRQAAAIVVAVPVAAADSCAAFRPLVDHVVCAMTPRFFRAVGEWYDDFTQTTDEEVRALLSEAQREQTLASSDNHGG